MYSDLPREATAVNVQVQLPPLPHAFSHCPLYIPCRMLAIGCPPGLWTVY